MSEQLEDVIADERGAAAVLRAKGFRQQAEMVEAICDRVSRAAEDYVRWLPEAQAMLRSGKKSDWFRRRFPQWLEEGNARKNGRVREYRQVIVPQRTNLDAARELALRVARGEGSAA